MVVCLEQDADLHMSQLMPLPLTVSCFNKIQIGFTFLVPTHLGSPGKRAVKWVCVLAVEMARQVNRHCVNCIGTFSFPISAHTLCHVIPTKRVVEGATWQQLMELRIDVVDDTRKVIS